MQKKLVGIATALVPDAGFGAVIGVGFETEVAELVVGIDVAAFVAGLASEEAAGGELVADLATGIFAVPVPAAEVGVDELDADCATELASAELVAEYVAVLWPS